MAEAGLEGLDRIGLELVVSLEARIEADDARGVLLFGKVGESVDDILREISFEADQQCAIGNAVSFAACDSRLFNFSCKLETIFQKQFE